MAEARRDELDKWTPYGHVKPVPANLRNWLMMLDVMEGKGPIYMRTEEAMANLAEVVCTSIGANSKLARVGAGRSDEYVYPHFFTTHWVSGSGSSIPVAIVL